MHLHAISHSIMQSVSVALTADGDAITMSVSSNQSSGNYIISMLLIITDHLIHYIEGTNDQIDIH